jgi:serine/threonine protein kinase/TolB-like protein/Tfp pilus assembly protein PilF
MSSPQWQQASEIVHAALKRPLPERTPFINSACAGNEALLQEVEILLRYYTSAESAQSHQPKPHPSEPLEQWWQTSLKTSPLRDTPTNKGGVDWFSESAVPPQESAAPPVVAAPPQTRTTDELPLPNFDEAELVAIPPGQPTGKLIYEGGKAQSSESDTAIPTRPAAVAPPPAARRNPFDQPSQFRTSPLSPPAQGQNGAAEPPASFETPTVRPVFDQPAPDSTANQPTYRPIFKHTPKPATPPPAYDPAAAPLHEDFPSLEPPKPKAPAARSDFDQPAQRVNFDQASQRPPGPPRSPHGGTAPTGPLGGSGAATAAARGQTRPLDGRMLAQYQLHYEIGRGAIGRVYLAQDTRAGRHVALKLLQRFATRDPEKVGRFEQDARAASALNHPNILTVYEIGEVKDVHYLATELVEGRTLRTLLERGRFKISIAVELAIQVASALETAHRANLIHRDIKPENLMLRTDGYVKVLDFGLAKLDKQVDGRTPPPGTSGTLPQTPGGAEATGTKPGLISGKACYLSPEQARGIRIDRRTDVFSLGLVLYEMITGQPAFNGPTPSDTLAALLTSEPAPLSRYLGSAPLPVMQGLQRILARALEKDRDRRYQSAREFAADLKAFKQSLGPGLPPEPPAAGQVAATQPLAATPAAVSPAVTETQAPSAAVAAPPETDEIVIELEIPPTAETALVAQPSKTSARPAGAARPLFKRWRLAFLLLLALLGLTALLYWAYGAVRLARAAGESIAVLPFEYTRAQRINEEEREYLADGLTESLIQRLSQLPKLKVIARNSVFRYKGKVSDPHEVGQALNVRTVLSGRITPHQNAWTVTIELADANTNAVLWGEQYDSKLTDLHLLQYNLATRIAQQLKLRLSAADQQRLARHDTENVEAYKLYLKGRHLWNQRTGTALKRSIENFQRAVLLDPNYARAYAALAESYVLAPIYSETLPEEAVAAGKDAAARALELDPGLAESHAALGFIRYQYEWNWAGAAQAYERALALNENYATGHQWYSSFLSSFGRAQEAIEHAERASELDPVSTPISTNLGAVLYYARRYPEAARQFQKALELNPNSPGVYAHLGMAYEQLGQPDKALTAYARAVALSDESTQMKMRYSHALVLAGRQAEARTLLDELQQNAPPGTVPLYQVALIYTALGDTEQALRTLSQAVALREEGIIWLKVDPQLDALRADAGFIQLVKKIGLEK